MVFSAANAKKRVRVYLDVCCLNRPFDSLSQERVRLEAEAVKSILFHIGVGQWTGVGSDVIDFEIGRMPDPDRQLEVGAIASSFTEYIRINESARQRGLELARLGFGPTDALHVACGEAARADVVLTTDDGLLRKANRHAQRLTVRVVNPLRWIEEAFSR